MGVSGAAPRPGGLGLRGKRAGVGPARSRWADLGPPERVEGRRERIREFCRGIWGRLRGWGDSARPSGGSVRPFGTFSEDGEALWGGFGALRVNRGLLCGDLGLSVRFWGCLRSFGALRKMLVALRCCWEEIWDLYGLSPAVGASVRVSEPSEGI